MATLVTTIKRFVGTSSESKPDDAPVGSTFFETNTGATSILTASGWEIQHDSGEVAAAATAALLAEMLSELRMLRLGLVLKGLAEELTTDDLPSV